MEGGRRLVTGPPRQNCRNTEKATRCLPVGLGLLLHYGRNLATHIAEYPRPRHAEMDLLWFVQLLESSATSLTMNYGLQAARVVSVRQLQWYYALPSLTSSRKDNDLVLPRDTASQSQKERPAYCEPPTSSIYTSHSSRSPLIPPTISPMPLAKSFRRMQPK